MQITDPICNPVLYPIIGSSKNNYGKSNVNASRLKTSGKYRKKYEDENILVFAFCMCLS
jgi:hypothetical protein